jgi:hypothetical protein
MLPVRYVVRAIVDNDGLHGAGGGRSEDAQTGVIVGIGIVHQRFFTVQLEDIGREKSALGVSEAPVQVNDNPHKVSLQKMTFARRVIAFLDLRRVNLGGGSALVLAVGLRLGFSAKINFMSLAEKHACLAREGFRRFSAGQSRRCSAEISPGRQLAVG